jgi:hypothetical protein
MRNAGMQDFGMMSSHLGVTLETMSRCFAELRRRRLIEVHAKDLRLLAPR